MNRLYLTLRYPEWRLWYDHFIYFYTDTGVACILDIRTDKVIRKYHKDLMNF